jgi:hypothetical protein
MSMILRLLLVLIALSVFTTAGVVVLSLVARLVFAH